MKLQAIVAQKEKNTMNRYTFQFGNKEYVVNAHTPEEAINKLEEVHGISFYPGVR